MESTKRPRSSSIDEELEVSYKRLCSIKRDEKLIDKKVKSIDKKLDQLYKKRDQYMARKNSLKSGPFEKALLPFSRSWNLAFVTKMRSRLPRELRDMVYEQLWMAQAQEIYFASLIRSMLFKWECNERPCQCLRYKKIPSFVDPAFVGPDVALEAAEAFYKIDIGKRWIVARDIDEIKPLVCKDAFHVGLSPTNILREIVINARMEEWLKSDKPPFTDQISLEEGFKSLYKIINKSGFRLRINLSQRNIRLKVLEEYLEMLRPILGVFIDEGAEVSLKWVYRHRESDLLPVERDLAPALKLTPEIWQTDMTEWLNKQENIAEYTREYLAENDEDYKPGPYFGDYFGESDTDDEDADEDGLYGAHWDYCPCGCGPLDDEHLDEEDDDYGEIWY